MLAVLTLLEDTCATYIIKHVHGFIAGSLLDVLYFSN